MTVPEERENDPFVLDALGFGTPGIPHPAQPPAVTANPMAAIGAEPVPMTRREARERERAGGETGEPRRSAPTTPSKGKPRAKRTAKNSTRRDAVRVASAKPKTTVGRRLLQVGAMLFAGALAIGMTVPANAFDWGADEPLADELVMPAQSVEVDPTLVSFAERDTWSVTSWAEMLKLKYGNRSFDYTVGSGPVRWPFPYAVPISSGYGDRAAPCAGCSTDHKGIDMNPGAGVPIYAIADGVVVQHDDSDWGLGNFVAIQHVIDGQTVYSGYAHMQTGSSPLSVGDTVLVGDFVGLVGETGQATGPHLHFSIGMGAVTNYVDPYTFLKRYAS